MAKRAAVLLLLMVACTRRETLCPGWELVRHNHLVEAGADHPSLYRRTGESNVEVDELVFTHHCFTNDCVIYGTDRGGSPQLYGVCGDREPVRLAVARDEIDQWNFTAAGYERHGPPSLRGGRLEREHWIYRANDLLIASQTQPPMTAGWWRKEIRTLNPGHESVAASPDHSSPENLLIAAIGHGDETTAVALIERGADLEMKDEFGRPPLILAAEHEMHEVVRRLLERGVATTGRNVRDEDVLTVAVNNHDVRMVEVLYDARSRIHVNVENALKVARELHQNDTVAILERWRAAAP
jgi:hypothetical protein